MKFDPIVLDGTEELSFALRTLYRSFGFTRYRMSKFEEYDLYAGNKAFLVSEHLITFTDLQGKLKALKPDVTLSIIKNHRDPEAGVLKLCYDEKVYRAASGGDFREIPQSGVECIGEVDNACIAEVLTLALKSLELIGNRFVLSVSDLGILSAFLKATEADPETVRAFRQCIAGKNAEELRQIGETKGLPKEEIERLATAATLSGPAFEVLPKLKDLSVGLPLVEELRRLEAVLSGVPEAFRNALELDFSVVGNPDYYNGIIFRGYVEGVPERVLSGGQYDGLAEKLGRKSKAVGFAVYLDTVERLEPAGGRRAGS